MKRGILLIPRLQPTRSPPEPVNAAENTPRRRAMRAVGDTVDLETDISGLQALKLTRGEL